MPAQRYKRHDRADQSANCAYQTSDRGDNRDNVARRARAAARRRSHASPSAEAAECPRQQESTRAGEQDPNNGHTAPASLAAIRLHGLTRAPSLRSEPRTERAALGRAQPRAINRMSEPRTGSNVRGSGAIVVWNVSRPAAFLSAKERNYLSSHQLRRLATIRADGSPHVVPVSFRFNADGTIDIGGPIWAPVRGTGTFSGTREQRSSSTTRLPARRLTSNLESAVASSFAVALGPWLIRNRLRWQRPVSASAE
jgi:hypothetical protein